MSSVQGSDTNKLGHDPLEWLGDNVSDELEATEATEATEVPETSENSENAKLTTSKTDTDPASHCFCPQGALTVAQAEDTHKTLIQNLNTLSAGQAWVIDLSALTHIDTSGYQLLISMIKTCQSKNVSVTLKPLSEPLLQQFAMLGDSTMIALQEESQ